MADDEQREEATSQGNGWEVVSLTSSAYAAGPDPGPGPGPELVDVNDDIGHRIEKDEAMFMSGHFIFPPKQREDLPLEPEEVEDQTTDEIGESFSRLGSEEGDKLDAEKEPGEFDEGAALQGLDLIEKEQMNTESKFSSFYSETTRGGSTTYDENNFIPGKVEPSERLLDSEMLDSSNNAEEDDEYDISKLPCEAWWKRGATYLYDQAKEANAFWSLFVAAAVMGLVVLGRHLHQEKLEALHLKWRLSFDSEKMKKLFGPISRVKELKP